ncbi:MAG: lipoyl synthase [Candidatus Heimdallarchaeota archaeon]
MHTKSEDFNGTIRGIRLRVQALKRQPKPKWIRSRFPTLKNYGQLKSVLKTQGLHTVCTEALCPNQTECWESRTATFMLLGTLCTRRCNFCDVMSGHPHQALNPEEPEKVAQAVSELGLRYVVLTSVTRDDLSDGGASHLSHCIQAIRHANPQTRIEILIPDFQGDLKAIQTIIDSKPDVIGHNVETTEVLTPKVRDRRFTFHQSLFVLDSLKAMNPHQLTKSSIMLGLGETDEQILATLRALRDVKVDIVTLGQYLQPSSHHMRVVEYITPIKFEFWKQVALELDFLAVISGPLVRSSYRASKLFVEHYLKTKRMPGEV